MNMLSDDANADVIYLDFAKAFDKVDHNILMHKLECLGITGKVLQWVKVFLSNRTQTVIVDGEHSLPQIVISGVPQGTVLGPLLFIVFINDIFGTVNHSVIRSFADDTRLTKQIHSVEDQIELQNDLNAVIKWAAQNNMELHEDKFELLHHGKIEALKAGQGHIYNLTDGSIINNTNCVKDLGVVIHESLKWSDHINEVSLKATQMSGWILRTFKTRNRLALMTLFKSLVRSRLDYCSPVWTPYTQQDIIHLESVQRSFTAKINSINHLNYWDRLKALNLMSLQRRRERYIILHTWKILCGMAPNDVGLKFYWNDRLGMKCVVPKLPSKESFLKSLKFNSFSSIGPRLFNTLPQYVKESGSFLSFKLSLDKFLSSLPDEPPTPGYVTSNNNSILDWATWKAGLSLKR